jgi:NADPH-dependent 2,4-dienoyl-CoA reductase/sulfur reductase-like enzyme
VDDTPWLGGQIWRGKPAPQVREARKWFARFGRCGARLLAGTCIIAAPEPGLLLAEQENAARQIRWKKLVIATGARELFLPFPGWTLPGVMGPGGLQALVKNGWPIEGKSVVVAGSGPLLLAVADGLRKHGAQVAAIAEQAPWSQVMQFGLGLWNTPGKFKEGLLLNFRLWGVPCRFGAWPLRAEGEDKVQTVTFTNGQRTWTENCDLFACGFGLMPNTELALAVGCRLVNTRVQVDEWQATSVSNVYCAGEPTGIGGADCALVEGEIAGYAAAGQTERAQSLFPRRASWHKFRTRLEKTFALRPELKTLATDDTLICRCEDVPLAHLKQFKNWREAKLQSRCGMGPCQGRICGAATQHIFGWGMESVRPPLLPARVQSLISKPERT